MINSMFSIQTLKYNARESTTINLNLVIYHIYRKMSKKFLGSIAAPLSLVIANIYNIFN